MILCFFFLFLFAGLALLTSFLVITSKNPIYSVLFLIVSFCNISALLLLLKFEFLPVVLIIVYVGAIAVLFLFVLMTLNLKIAETKRQTASYTPFLVLLALLFFFQVVSLTRVELSTILIELKQLYVFSDLANGSVNFSSFSLFSLTEQNTRQIGQMLFTVHAFQFLAVGFVLLFAMLGAIILTLQKRFVSRSQNVYYQVIRNFNDCIYLVN